MLLAQLDARDNRARDRLCLAVHTAIHENAPEFYRARRAAPLQGEDLAQLSHAHAPGPRGSPQLPQGPGIASRAALLPLVLTAKVESIFWSFLLLHSGHAGVVDLMTSSSNWWSHFLQWYSNNGIAESFRLVVSL